MDENFVVDLFDPPFAILAAGFRRLRDELAASAELRSAVVEQGIDGVLNSDHPALVHLRKARGELATQAEADAEAAIAAAIHHAYPADGVIGEENRYEPVTDARRIWLIDPLDGTSEAIQQLIADICDVPRRRRGAFAITVGAITSSTPEVGAIHELCFRDGELVQGDLWVGTPGGPTRCNGRPVPLRAHDVKELRDATIACTVPEVMFPRHPDGTESLPSLRLVALRGLGAKVVTDLNAVGAMRVAGGSVDAFVEADITAPDLGALLGPLLGAGLTTTDLEGAPLQLDACSLAAGPARDGKRDGTYQILAAPPRLHLAITEVMQRLRREHPDSRGPVGGTASAHGYTSKAHV
ncbi:MAG: inositol monophosphatase family protein [Acidimicrobiales bacterium]